VKVLFDQGTPAPLRRALIGHTVETAYERGWSELQNGELIAAAEAAGFEVFVTTDRNLKYQQNLSARALSIVVLLTTSWPRIQRSLPAVLAAVGGALAGGYAEVHIE
jgi:predicted nuclease of predicted toxin-antitoxin system